MNYKMILAAASAVLLSASGAAMADQNHYMGHGQTSANGDITNRVNGEHPVEHSDVGEQQGSPETEMHALPQSSYLHGIRNADLLGARGDRAILGRPVVDATGRQVGEVSRVTPDGVVISVGRAMGIGAHDVLLKPDQLTATRERGQLAVISSLNEGQLEKLPDYKAGQHRSMR